MKDRELAAKVAAVLSRLDDIQLELSEIRQWAVTLASREKGTQDR